MAESTALQIAVILGSLAAFLAPVIFMAGRTIAEVRGEVREVKAEVGKTSEKLQGLIAVQTAEFRGEINRITDRIGRVETRTRDLEESKP